MDRWQTQSPQPSPYHLRGQLGSRLYEGKAGVDQSSGKRERLPDIFIVEFRILALPLSAIWIHGENLKDAPNREAQVAYAPFAILMGSLVG
jgi:hypothetical protein